MVRGKERAVERGKEVKRQCKQKVTISVQDHRPHIYIKKMLNEIFQDFWKLFEKMSCRDEVLEVLEHF